MRSSDAARVIAEQPVTKRAWIALSAYNVALGMALLVGGAPRISTASFDVMRVLGGSTVWGLGLLLVGGLLLSSVAHPHTLRWVLLLASVLHFWLAVCFASAVTLSPVAALTGPITYTAIAWWHFSIAEAFRSGPQL